MRREGEGKGRERKGGKGRSVCGGVCVVVWIRGSGQGKGLRGKRRERERRERGVSGEISGTVTWRRSGFEGKVCGSRGAHAQVWGRKETLKRRNEERVSEGR